MVRVNNSELEQPFHDEENETVINSEFNQVTQATFEEKYSSQENENNEY